MNTKVREISNMDDIIDVRDIIARVEELEAERDAHEGEDALATWRSDNEDDAAELDLLTSLLEDLKGYSGDVQWRGDRYPITLIRDSYFKQYAMQFADDVGAINAEATWPNNCIDWDRATSELQCDYSTVEYEGVTYWYC